MIPYAYLHKIYKEHCMLDRKNTHREQFIAKHWDTPGAWKRQLPSSYDDLPNALGTFYDAVEHTIGVVARKHSHTVKDVSAGIREIVAASATLAVLSENG